MANYPKDIPAVLAAMQSYATAPSSIAGDLGSAMLRASPVDRIVETFGLLAGVMNATPAEGEELEILDAAGLELLAGCAELLVLHNFHGKQSEALGVRDAAIARLEALG